ncbi:hypothetical protein BS47DRAFT_1365020 [Hydnum rufescens UP504]|uniref:Uncharacterized protein n=1 Tax=Hydnum rufescens UP504 TaxID=1448309 RepID=A0A9P6DTM1_9AGAM|nr:hypothetical protein BS47DRAFT_1365020 [Hydnum rufescens UP504]
MKKWDKQNVDVTKYIIHINVPLVHVQHLVNWFIRLHLGYPGELDHNDRPLCEAASRVLPAGKICKTDVVTLQDFLGRGLWPAAQAYKVPKFYYKYEFGEVIKIYVNEDDSPMASSSKAVGNNMEDHGFNIYDDIMGNPYDEDNNNWENEGDYDLNPTPHLDAKQEAEAKALVLTAESGDGTAKSQITKVLQGEKKQAKKLAQERWHAEADTVAAPQIRALEEAQRLEAERLKWEAEEHVRLQQGGHASVAPAPSSVPAPPVPALQFLPLQFLPLQFLPLQFLPSSSCPSSSCPSSSCLPVPSAPASVPNPARPCTPTLTPTSLEPGSPHTPTYSPVTPRDPLIIRDPLVIRDPLIVCDPLIVHDPLVIRNPLVIHDPLIVHDPFVVHDPLVMHNPLISPLLLIEPGLPLVKVHPSTLATQRKAKITPGATKGATSSATRTAKGTTWGVGKAMGAIKLPSVQELERQSHGCFRDDHDGQMWDGPWQSALSSKAPTHQPLPQPAWRPRTPPLSSGPPPSCQDPPSPPQPEATPLLSRLGPAPMPFPQGSVAPTASVALSVSDMSMPWPPPECLRLANGVDGQEDPLTWVHQNPHLGVLAARRVKPIQKKGTMYHMYLLFKDVAKRDSCWSVLVSSCGGKTLLPFLYMDTLVNCFGVAEVRYMQEVYINAISTAEIQELLAVGPCRYATPSDAIPEMLDYIQYPALLDPHPAPPKHERTRAMISVEFDTEWLSR